MKNKHCDLLHLISGGINNIISVPGRSDEIGIFHLKATSECMSSWRNSGIALINQIRANKRCWIKRLQDEECSSQHFSWPEWEPFKFSTISLVSLKWHCCSLARMKKTLSSPYAHIRYGAATPCRRSTLEWGALTRSWQLQSDWQLISGNRTGRRSDFALEMNAVDERHTRED